jgi:hypothetical protein
MSDCPWSKDNGIKQDLNNIIKIIGGAIIISAPILLLYYNSCIEEKESLCPIMRCLNIPCPGCGLTKSLVCLIKGDLYSSISYHPFGIIIEIITICVLLFSIKDIIYKSNTTDKLLNHPLLWKILAIFFFIFYVIRLLHYYIKHDYWF